MRTLQQELERMGFKPEVEERVVTRSQERGHPFGSIVPTIVVTPPNACYCGWRRPPEGHNCLWPIDLKIWEFTYVDGGRMYVRSRIDPERMAVATWNPSLPPLSDAVLLELLGVRQLSDLISHDKDAARSDNTLDMLRAIQDNPDLAPVRKETSDFVARGFTTRALFSLWKPLKFTEVPPMWRRVALGDVTVKIEPKERPFSGKDPFEPPKVQDPATVGWSHVRDGALMKNKPVHVR